MASRTKLDPSVTTSSPIEKLSMQLAPPLQKRLIYLVIVLGGSYYLPYNQYASVLQFRAAYPRWKEFKQCQITESSWSKNIWGVDAMIIKGFVIVGIISVFVFIWLIVGFANVMK